MYQNMNGRKGETAKNVLEDSQNMFHTLMGKQPELTSFQAMVEIRLFSGSCISQMY